MNDMATDADTEFAEKEPANAPCGHARSGLASRRPLQNVSGVASIVLEHSREIHMARTRPSDGSFAVRISLTGRRIHDLLPVFPVPILNEHCDRRSQGLAATHSRQELDVIRFDLHPASAAVALLAARKVDVDVRSDYAKPCHHSLEDGDERKAV